MLGQGDEQDRAQEKRRQEKRPRERRREKEKVGRAGQGQEDMGR